LVNHGFVFQDDPAVRDQLSSAVAGARHAAAARAPELAAAARRAQARVLTAAVRRVLERVPDGLNWRQHVALTGLASFEAEGRDEQGMEHLYSVNIVSDG
jgi:nucleoid DNA-binding protein